MERLTIWFQPRHSSIELVGDGGVRHDTSAPTMAEVLKDLRAEDKEVVRGFCERVLRCLNGDCKALDQ